jgi:hypothetical protein
MPTPEERMAWRSPDCELPLRVTGTEMAVPGQQHTAD